MLERILHQKRDEVALRRSEVSLAELRQRVIDMPPPRDIFAALHGRTVAVIAEIKRASPSRGPLALDLDPALLARDYERGGAAAISVLTDQRFFGGSLADLAQARAAVNLPVLRKDFLIDEYQVYESRAAGADVALLIVAALAEARLRDLLTLAHEIDLPCLVEAHSGEEVTQALACGATLIGVNSRDLRTFAVDLSTLERLARLVPPQCTLVAESGIHHVGDVARVAAAGADAVLVGEALVRAPDVDLKLRELAAVPRRARQPDPAER